MPIRVEQPGLAQLYGAAATLSKAEKEAQRKQEQESRKEEMQMQMQYQQNMKMLDAQLDLEMYERSKRWEIDKMELRSRMDFERVEQIRQRKLDSIDSAIQQIDKEVLAGRMTEQEAYPLKLKYEVNKMGVDIPTSLLPVGDEEEDGFGVKPYWMRGRDAPEGTPERQLYEAKMAEQISGERRGTVPWDLDPRYIRTAAAEESRVNRGIFLEPEDIDEFLGMETAELPLTDKQLNVGVRAEGVVSGLPTVTSDAEYDALPSGTEFVDQSGKRWRKP